jgi:hypothetical protein
VQTHSMSPNDVGLQRQLNKERGAVGDVGGGGELVDAQDERSILVAASKAQTKCLAWSSGRHPMASRDFSRPLFVHHHQ